MKFSAPFIATIMAATANTLANADTSAASASASGKSGKSGGDDYGIMMMISTVHLVDFGLHML